MPWWDALAAVPRHRFVTDTVWFKNLGDASEDEFPVRQCGPRRLWDEVANAHQWWVEQGKPGADSWCFTVTPDGQRIELV
ncbi:MAG: hypothetical protein ACRDTG_13790 [Pseudonocardiaceae bacterium]